MYLRDVFACLRASGFMSKSVRCDSMNSEATHLGRINATENMMPDKKAVKTQNARELRELDPRCLPFLIPQSLTINLRTGSADP